MANETTTTRRKPVQMSVAEYLEHAIKLSGKTQSQIASECGFNKPNVITMFKQGQTKVPLSKVGVLAKALGVDPMHLFKLVMSEYEPTTWTMIENIIMNQPVLTQAELEMLQVIREANVENPRIRTDAERQRLIKVVESFATDGTRG